MPAPRGNPLPAEAPTQSIALFDRARKVIPGGVNSPVRAFHAVGGVPRFIARGAGPHLYDADGRRYLDVKYAGCYHGHADHLLVSAGSGLATFGKPSSAGVPAAFVECTRVLPLDDEKALTELFDREGSRIAAVVIEPIPANHGLLLQRAEYLRA